MKHKKKQRHRPIYHMLPEKHWMNDPNGPIFHNGLYHLFYQHNPEDAKWGNIHWGHSVSRDLVNWNHRPLALYPSREEGELHCFSGCSVIRDDGTPMIFYTSVGEGERNSQTGAQQWAAVGSIDLDDWVKVHHNPVIDQSVHGDTKILEWRDPFVFRHEDDWMMVVGGTVQGHGCAALYRALDTDLYQWEYLGILDRDTQGSDMWECPVMFPHKGRYILMYSPYNSMRYAVGDFDGRRFTPKQTGVVDYGGWQGFYAGNTCYTHDGRVVMFAWMPEVLRVSLEQAGYTWSGVQSFPRIIDIDEDDRLLFYPVESVSLLHDRDNAYIAGDLEVQEETILPIRGKALDIAAVLQFDPGKTESFGIELLSDEQGRERTRIILCPGRGRAEIDRSGSCAKGMPHAIPTAGPWNVREDHQVDIRVLLDHSTLEVFIDSRLCISTRVYPYFEHSDLLKLFAHGTGVQALLAEVYPMRPAQFSRSSAATEQRHPDARAFSYQGSGTER